MKYFSSNAGGASANLSSDLVMAGDIGFLAGMLPVELHNGRAALSESVEAQMLKVLGNMESILAGHGMSRHNVVSVNIHVTEFKRFQERVDEAYRGFFDSAKLPTRSLVGVDQLPRGAMVSLDFVVHRG